MQEEERVVVVRFGHDADATCMQMDAALAAVADQIKNFAVIYLVDISEVRTRCPFVYNAHQMML